MGIRTVVVDTNKETQIHCTDKLLVSFLSEVTMKYVFLPEIILSCSYFGIIYD